MTSSLARLLLLAACGLGLVPTVQAEQIAFTYAWSVQPSPVFASGTGSVTVIAAPNGPATYDTTSALPTYIPAAELTTTSSATSPPDTFNTPFNLKLTLTDTASSLSDELTFSGTLAGTLTMDSSTLTSTFSSPLTKTLILGDFTYSVTIGPTLVNIPGPGSSTPALIDARVTVERNDTPVQETPEPGSLLLGATAILGFAARRYWKR